MPTDFDREWGRFPGSVGRAPMLPIYVLMHSKGQIDFCWVSKYSVPGLIDPVHFWPRRWAMHAHMRVVTRPTAHSVGNFVIFFIFLHSSLSAIFGQLESIAMLAANFPKKPPEPTPCTRTHKLHGKRLPLGAPDPLKLSLALPRTFS